MASLNMRTWIGLSAVLVGLAVSAASSAQQTVFVVRHAERLDGVEELKALKNPKDPPLSAIGTARAGRLAAMLAASRVNTIYVTQYQRTALTAAPLAKALGVTMTEMPAGDTPALVARIATQKPEDVVLVVGHSNTVGAILKGLGATEVVNLTEADYDNFFVVVPKAGSAPAVTRLKY